MTQKAAVNFCENELQVRAHLLEVDTVEENAAIQAEILRRPANVWLGITNPWIKDQGPWSLVLILDSGPWSLILTWPGITDKNSEGNWKLQSTGESVVFTNWGTNEPSNDNSNEHCAYLGCGGHIYSGCGSHWNDIGCSLDHGTWNSRDFIAVCEVNH